MDSALHALIGLIYDASLDPARWATFLEAYARTVKATATCLMYHDVPGHRGVIYASANSSLEANRLYNEHYVAVDPFLNESETRGLLRTGALIIGDDIVERVTLKRTEYYNDFARRYGLTRMMGGVIRRDGREQSSVTSLRPDRMPAFGRAESRVLREILPHLCRARQVQTRLATAERTQSALLDAMDRLPLGVLIARSTGPLVFMNRAASRVLDQADGISCDSTGLMITSPSASRAVRSLVHGAASTANGEGFKAGGAVSVPRPSMRQPFSLLVAPLRTRSIDGFEDAGGLALIFLSDPESAAEVDCDVLTRLWGLTRAEATVASRLASGSTLSEIAEQLSITSGTARWHLKNVLAKSSTKRQADLVRVLVSGPATIKQPRR